jgi:hypothetical protein
MEASETMPEKVFLSVLSVSVLCVRCVTTTAPPPEPVAKTSVRKS